MDQSLVEESLIYDALKKELFYPEISEAEYVKCKCSMADINQMNELRRWMQMLTSYNQILQQLQLPLFPSNEQDLPTYLSCTYNIINRVLTYRQSIIKSNNLNDDEISKQRSDNDALKVKIKRMQDDLDSKSKQLGLFENQFSISSKQSKSNLEKLTVEKDELNKIILKMQNKMNQMMNEFKKKELEFAKIKEQFKTKMLDKNISFLNRVESMRLNNSMVGLPSNDQVGQNRKSIQDEACNLQEILFQILEITQNFYRNFQSYINIEPINPDMIKLPRTQFKCLQIISLQFNKLTQIFQIMAPKLNDEELKFIKQSDDQPQPQKPIFQKQNLTRQTSLKFSAKKEQPAEQQDTNKIEEEDVDDQASLSQSIVSRVSLADIPEFQNSPRFKQEPPKIMAPLSKWEFVFKQKDQN